MAEEQWVLMVHQSNPDAEPTKVAMRSFVKVWQPKGWTLVDNLKIQGTTPDHSDSPETLSDDNPEEDV